VATAIKNKRAIGTAPHVIFISFFCVSIILSPIHTKADNLIVVSYSVICCDRDQLSTFKYFYFTKQYEIQSYRTKNLT